MKAAIIQQSTRSQHIGGSGSIQIHSEYSPLSTKKAVLYQIIDLNKTENANDSDESLIIKEESLPGINCDTLDAHKGVKQIELLNGANRSFLYSCTTLSTLQEVKNDVDSINQTWNHNLTESTTDKIVEFNDVAATTITTPSNNIESIDDDDSRVTGGGEVVSNDNFKKPSNSRVTVEKLPVSRKTSRDSNGPRKISFKIRNSTVSNRRFTSSTITTTTTLNGSKVAELTQKFNEMIKDNDSILKQPKFAKIIEKIQHKNSDSNSSTPSSTLTPSTNIRIVTKIKPNKKKPNLKKKSASESTADSVESSNSRKKVQRVRSDGHPRQRNSIRKRNINSDLSKHSNNQTKESNKLTNIINEDIKKKCCLNVKRKDFLDKIKHFETNSPDIQSKNITPVIVKPKCETEQSKPPIAIKPIVPEKKPIIPAKKDSLAITKNIVLRDGKPKIKVLKPNSISNSNNVIRSTLIKTEEASAEQSRKENIYDKFKFRTSFLKGSKLQLLKSDPISEHCELVDELTVSNNLHSDDILKNKNENDQQNQNINLLQNVNNNVASVTSLEDEIYQKISVNLKPNESFLWNNDAIKKDQIYSDIFQIFDYDAVQVSKCENHIVPIDTNNDDSLLLQAQDIKTMFKKTDLILDNRREPITDISESEEYDHEVEAINITVINKLSETDTKTVTEAINSQVIDHISSKLQGDVHELEDDYEPLEPFRETVEADSDQFENTLKKTKSISSYPLPAVPVNDGENIYQCLFELRSYPEGDRKYINHNYKYFPDKVLEQRTSGDGESDDGYEYCKAPEKIPTKLGSTSMIQQQPLPQPNEKIACKNYIVTKTASNASSIGYEKIYEKISCNPTKFENSTLTTSKDTCKKQLTSTESINSYDTLNGNENVYDIIKHSDSMSLNNCYESIPNSPHSVVKLRNKMNNVQNVCPGKRLSFDTVSNFSHSTVSSEQKTNSIYGQRSVVNFGMQETVAYGPAVSEISLSDRSDDWVDMTDTEDQIDHNTIVIIRERARGRKSPTSWSQKVRHQWHKSPRKNESGGDSSDSEHYYESLHPASDHSSTTVDGGACGSTSRSLAFDDEEDDFDSFDSDSDTGGPTTKTKEAENKGGIEISSLPAPPSTSNVYTLTRFASAAGKKMRELKRNLTKSAKKRYSGSLDSTKSPLPNSVSPKSPTSPSNSLLSRLYEPKILRQKSKTSLSPNSDNVYENTNFSTVLSESSPINNQPKAGPKIYGSQKNIYPAALVTLPPNINYESATQLNLELKNALNEKRLSLGKVSVENDKTACPVLQSQLNLNEVRSEKVISRKTYFSFKTKFRRCTSMVADHMSEVPSALKITNSTFYLTDSVDVDSGFSNCSDSGQTVTSSSTEAIQCTASIKKDSPKLSHNSADIDKDNGDSNNGKDCSSVLSNETNSNPSPVDKNKFKTRPLAPPPPPPESGDLKRLFPSFNKKDKRSNSSTSWYAECGLFDAVNQKQGASNNGPKDRPTSTSWYAEVGLYQAGNISTSSGASSSTSTTSPPPPSPPPPPPIHGRFQQEPLYQFYNAAKVESVCREHVTDSDSDGYEEISDLKNGERAVVRPSAMALVSPLKGPSRTLWCEIPEVINSAVLSSLSSNQKKLQEAKFEIITSEASYLNSLTVLEKYFMNHSKLNDDTVLSKVDHDIMFGTIQPVKKCSELFMNELEECWQDNILLYGLSEIVKRYAEKNFHVYITYCENQIYLVRALQRLKANAAFAAVLSTLETQSACHGLSLHSFLMLPMQRVTRMPLLVDAVLKNLDPSDDEYQTYMDTLATLNNFVSQCNEGARNMERVDEMCRIASFIDFPFILNNPPDLAPSCIRNETTGKVMQPKRWLVRSGEVVQFTWRGDEVSKLTFGKKFIKMPISLFLFTDILIIAKKHSDESYSAIDYCIRSLIEMSPGDVMGQLNMKETAGKFTMLLTLLENHEKKTVEMLLSCSSETDRQRWIAAFSAPTSNNPEETVYEGWDCPQVAAIYSYQPMQPDELALQEGDIVNVSKKMADGWYHGERIRDGETGWFPGNYTCEIASPHVRARNLRQRYRLLALSGSYLGQQRKK